MREETKKELKDIFDLKRLFFVILGNTIYAAGIAAFVLPTGLITGGTTGLGLIANHYFQIPIELFAAVFNITMFILAIVVLGKSFALTSLISTFYFPVILGVFQKVEVLRHLTDDLMLCTIFSGLCIGIGIGMVIKVGNFVGCLILALIFVGAGASGTADYFAGFIGNKLSIPLGQMFFRDTEKSLYGILLVIIYTVLVDKVLLMGKNQMQVKIISDEYKKINTMIHQKLDRGTTLYKTETGYLHKDGFAIFTVVSNRELPKLNEMVLEIDNKAFMVINQVNEVKGRGFTLGKIKM